MPKKHRKNKKKKKKKDAVPWYMMEEIMREEEAAKQKQRDAEDAQRKLEEHQAWYNSVTPDERLKYDTEQATMAKKNLWKEIQNKKEEEEELLKRKEQERIEMAKRRQEERDERKKLAAEGKLEITGVLLEKCVSCGLTAYSHEQIIVGTDVFHKIGCFRCFFL